MIKYNCVKPGEVFVEWTYRRGKDRFTYYKRMLKTKAIKEKRKIIECSKCDKPAYHIDNFWPYYNDYNLCRKHWIEEKNKRAIKDKLVAKYTIEIIELEDGGYDASIPGLGRLCFHGYGDTKTEAMEDLFRIGLDLLISDKKLHKGRDND